MCVRGEMVWSFGNCRSGGYSCSTESRLGLGRIEDRLANRCRNFGAGTAAAEGFGMVTFLAMFGQVEALDFNIFDWPQPHGEFDGETDDGGSDDCEDQGQKDGFDLLIYQRLQEAVGDDAFEIGGEICIGSVARQGAGEESAKGAPNGMDAESIEGIIVAEPGQIGRAS